VRLEAAAQLDVQPGGAEANLAALLARLRRRTAWHSSLPANPLGRLAANALRGAGVDLGGVQWVADGRMGTYYVEFSPPPRSIQVIYDRARSCMTEWRSEQVNWELLLDTRLLHLTGITPALSPSCRAIVVEAVARAAAAGVPISFDVNYRQKLWDEQTAAATLAPLLREAAVIFCGRSDAQRLFGCTGEAQEGLRGLAAQFAMRPGQVVVMSAGSAGVLAWRDGEILQVDAVPVTIIDRLGAGDALAAGVLHGWLDGDLLAGLRTGVVTAALALAQHGDMVITTPQEVTGLLAAASDMIVR
jgi:2-dehydro-3-deoxygluconokinase